MKKQSENTKNKPHIMAQLALIFGFCLAGEWLGGILSFPASVSAMLLLTLALLCGVVKPSWVADVAAFLLSHMGFFFVAVCVGIMEHFQVIGENFIPFMVIACFTTPLVYGITAWSIQLCLKKTLPQEEREI